MFKDKIQQLLNCLEIMDTNFAARAGVDRSLISRLKTGQRIPKPDSKSLKKIIDTIYSIALENNKLNDLCDLMGQAGLEDCQAVKHKILEFLYSDIKLDDRNETHHYDNFSHRLDKVMKSLSLTNVRLAKIINMDPSIISRFRRGERTPRSNKQLMLEISNSIYNYTLKMGKEDELLKLTRASSGRLTSEWLYNWLYSMEKGNEVADQLVKIINSFNFKTHYELLPLEVCISDKAENNPAALYLGINGLRQVVKRFIYNVIHSDCKNLFLFSDQKMEWMNDPQFAREWASMMGHCLKAGVTIHIIHNIERSMEEMLGAIAKWTPLYMSGCIIPYYSRSVYKPSGFTHTLFIAQGLATVEGWGVVGKEENITYHYYDNQLKINNSLLSFNKMLEDCAPLMKISFDGFKEEFQKIQYIIQEKKNCEKWLPQEALLHKEKHGNDAKLADYKIYNLEKIPFNDTRLIIGTDFVCVMKLDEPKVNFCIYNPTMCNAFRKYAEIFLKSIGMEL